MASNEVSRLEVLTALNRAGLAAARTTDPEGVYASVAQSLKDAGFFASIYAVEGESARLVHSSFAEKAVKVVERHTGLRQDAFEVRLDEVPFFRKLMTLEEAVLFDTAGLLGEVFPAKVKWLAGSVARVIKIRKGIGAAVRDEQGRPVALLFLLGDELTAEDVATASAFSQLLGLTLGRLRTTRALEQHLESLKTAQHQLAQAQKIEAIGRLTGGIAHDFNNLLTPALCAVSELEDPRVCSPEGLEAVDIIRQSLERCSDLTRSLLTFGRRQASARRRVFLDDALGDALRLVRASFPEDVRLDWFPGAVGATVEADVTQLHQVMINLALNARDAMPCGGTFTVTTRVLSIGLVEIECTDTGEGIAPGALAHIFEPFFTTKTVGKGTGLGLAVVDGIVREHGGTISVESEPGAGTTFRVRLPPPCSDSSPVILTPIPMAVSLTGRRVLVVEDDLHVRRMVVRVLTKQGHLVCAAASLTQARQLRETAGPFDLLLTDVVLGDGRSPAEAATLHRAGQRVLLVTGHPLDPNVLPAELNKVPVLLKPFGPRELLAVVEAALR